MKVDAVERLRRLLLQDELRMKALQSLAQLKIASAYIAAGFVRNAIWDSLHQRESTPLNDIDVIYFDPDNIDKLQDEKIQQRLQHAMPDMNWEVKNQARMHIKNNHAPYLDCCDAMSYWPEKETAIAVRLHSVGKLQFISPFDIADLFAGCITHNPKRSKHLFNQRVEQKKWLSIWPNLTVKLD